jgi:D-lactate dehydrogenase (cytochrome)
MKAFRHALPERINSLVAYRKQNIKELTKIGTDMAVPDKYLSKIIKFYKKELEKNSLEYYIFGHIGNAHLHVNILPKNIDELKLAKEIYKRFAKKVVKYRGSVSAEHGIGRLKKEFLLIQYNKREINIMKEIKATLDPESILNYGVLF